MRALAVALVAVAACTAVPSRDDVLHDRLVGKWSTAQRFANGHQQQSIELSDGGLMRIERTYHDGSGDSKAILEGRWRVENGEFVFQTSQPCVAPREARPAECRERIVAVTEWEWVMEEAAGGPEFRAWRYPK